MNNFTSQKTTREEKLQKILSFPYFYGLQYNFLQLLAGLGDLIDLLPSDDFMQYEKITIGRESLEKHIIDIVNNLKIIYILLHQMGKQPNNDRLNNACIEASCCFADRVNRLIRVLKKPK